MASLGDDPRTGYVGRVSLEEPVDVEESARDRARLANRAHSALADDSKRPNGATVLILSFVAFVFVSSQWTSLPELGLLVAVLLLHEGGHLLGMRMFGFSDLRMFFLPFVGAAASGRKLGASAVEHAIVSLMGPVPGLLLALVLAFLVDGVPSTDAPMPISGQLVLMLVLINGFNLLPMLPLDGGRLFQTLLFARTPTLEVLFRLFAIAGLGWLAVQGSWVLGVVAVFMLLRTRFLARQAFEAARLRRVRRFSSDHSSLADDELLLLAEAADRTLGSTQFSEANRKVVWPQAVRDIFDRVAHPLPKWWQTLLLLFVWALALLVGVLALAVLYGPTLHQR